MAGGEASPKKKAFLSYNVVLLNDDDHTYEYVIEMLDRLFGYPPEMGFVMAREVDTTGRVVVATGERDQAVLEAARIQTYGPDPRLARCRGSMSALVEPATG